jgi:hypothetical protein
MFLFVDRLDEVPHQEEKTSPQQNATQAQLPEKSGMGIPSEVIDLIGGGAWTRTTDLRIMSRPAVAESSQLQQDSSADSGKVLQNPHPPRTKKWADD